MLWRRFDTWLASSTQTLSATKQPSLTSLPPASGKYSLHLASFSLGPILSLFLRSIFSLVMEYANSGDLAHRIRHMRDKD